MARRTTQPAYAGFEIITKDEYEKARTMGIPASYAPYGFLSHNVIGHEPDRNVKGRMRTLHVAYLHFAKAYWRMNEPMSDTSFQAMRLHKFMDVS